MDDTISTLLRGVADGSITVDDARTALQDASLTEEQMQSAIDKGVFNPAEPGSIISATLAPSGASNLTMLFFVWGLFWACYWSFSMLYGLFNHWDQQQLSFHLAMTLTTIILMGIIYLKYVLPDTIIVKYARNKFVPEHQKDWQEYKW
ncbi:MAG: hypothetical protein HOL72_05795 [Euryarchaeota archaeon]|nr:hypothetical protein [Euryarchaeota archaeon]MBT5255258.1 hypothetical protein [Euryarchaeota archaeon]MDG1546364.1 hypothetical protein [Candidatus Poseidoniaceae archaeon]